MNMSAVLPPLDGSLPTLTHFVDFNAKHNPQAPWLIFPSETGGTGSITFAEMAEASHRVAHILRPQRRGPEGQVIAVILQTDTILYVAILLGIMRAGCIVSSLTLIRQHTL